MCLSRKNTWNHWCAARPEHFRAKVYCIVDIRKAIINYILKKLGILQYESFKLTFNLTSYYFTTIIHMIYTEISSSGRGEQTIGTCPGPRVSGFIWTGPYLGGDEDNCPGWLHFKVAAATFML